MSEIEMKIKDKTKDLGEICEKLTKTVSQHLEESIKDADTQETGAVIDMIKDLAIAKEKTIKGMYYEQLMEAMSGSEYGEDYDEDGPRYYRGRSARTGRFVHRGYEEHMMRDMDKGEGRMYYAGEDARSYTGATVSGGMSTGGSTSGGMSGGTSGGSSRGYEEGYEEGHRRGYREASSDYDHARKGYEESKEKEKKGGSKEQKLQALNEYLNTITEDLAQKMMDMDSQEKTVLKNKLQALQNKIV